MVVMVGARVAAVMVAARVVVRAAEVRAAGARAAEVMAVCPARHADHQLVLQPHLQP